MKTKVYVFDNLYAGGGIGSMHKNKIFIVHCKEDPIYVFPEMKLRRLVLNFILMYL
jgi:hypothetical protein